MRNFFNFLIGLLTAIALFLAFAVWDSETDPKPTTFEDVNCITSDEFMGIINMLGGKLTVDGDVSDGGVFVVVYPDYTFGLYIYLMGSDMVCSLDAATLEGTPLAPVGVPA